MPHLRFTDHSSLVASATESTSTSRYLIDDRRIARLMGGHLSARHADLITLAMSVYAADRIAKRTSAWRRDLDLEVPVADPSYWSARRAAIESLLHAVSDDNWSFRFVAGRQWRAAEQQLTLLRLPFDSKATVGLFSGGLDSLAGAARHIAGSQGPLILLGARSSFVVGRDQRVLAHELERLWPGRVSLLRVPLGLRNAGDGEQSQRTRALLYLVLGTIAAHIGGLRNLLVFENGVGAHNPRVAESQWGSQANLATHPSTLGAFSHFIGQLEIEVDITLPHRFETKAEHLSRMPSEARPLIPLTASCDSYPLRRADVTHCGIRCASCILRRQSLLASSLDPYDRTDYDVLPFQAGSNSDVFMLAARQAWQFTELRADSDRQIEALWPSLGSLTGSTRAEVVDLLRRYGEEWAAIIRTRPQVALAAGWPIENVA